MITETSAIKFGGTRLEYGIRRSSRRKTVAVAVDPEDGVLLTAPQNIAVNKLDDLVRARASWILERLRWIEQPEARRAPRELVSGESFFYLGRSYRLRALTATAEPGCRLDAGFLVVRLEKQRGRADRARAIRALLEAWFRRRASERIPERVSLWMHKVGVSSTGEVLVRSQQKRSEVPKCPRPSIGWCSKARQTHGPASRDLFSTRRWRSITQFECIQKRSHHTLIAKGHSAGKRL